MRTYPIPKPVNEMSVKELASVTTQALTNFHYFCEVILGYEDMNAEHKALCDFLQYAPMRKKLALAPRYTFKSCITSQGLSLWFLARDPNERILIYSDTATKAEKFLKGIKGHIEGGGGKSRFREIFGDYSGERMQGQWNDSSIITCRRTENAVEPSIDTAGIDTTKVGMHYNVIIFDDIVSKVNVSTKQQMDKVYETYTESHALLKPKGLIFITGTRWAFTDTYGRIIDRNKELPDFSIYIRDSEAKNGKGELIYADIGLDRTHLDSLKRDMGDYTYSALMRIQ
jgi:hypothetical protein